MHDDLTDLRVHELLRSPGGCALLVKMAHANMAPAEAVEPETAIHLVANAVGELNPWSATHDAMIERLLQEGHRHADLARALVREPGVERWWAPLDRKSQVWMQPSPDVDVPSPETFRTPDQLPDSWERYAQKPGERVSTSTRVGDWTSQLATCASGETDWYLDYPAERRLIRIASDARVLEIVTAEDWHEMVVQHGVRSDPANPHSDEENIPWGANDGLVPDWSSIAREWDGVHVTLWAFLTGTQVRITSDAGWTEMWSAEGEETTWLRWVFDAIEETPPVEPHPRRRDFWLPFHVPSPSEVRMRIVES